MLSEATLLKAFIVLSGAQMFFRNTRFKSWELKWNCSGCNAEFQKCNKAYNWKWKHVSFNVQSSHFAGIKKKYICDVFNSDFLKCQIFGLKDGIILLFSLLRIYKLKRNVVELATASSITSLFRYDPL